MPHKERSKKQYEKWIAAKSHEIHDTDIFKQKKFSQNYTKRTFCISDACSDV